MKEKDYCQVSSNSEGWRMQMCNFKCAMCNVKESGKVIVDLHPDFRINTNI